MPLPFKRTRVVCILLLVWVALLQTPEHSRAQDFLASEDLTYELTGAAHGSPGSIQIGELVEGTSWNAPGVVVFPSPNDSLTIQLRQSREVVGLAIQADNNDSYIVESYDPGGGWSRLWTVPPILGSPGLRTRWKIFDQSRSLTQIRIRPGENDGAMSVSAAALITGVPSNFEPPDYPNAGWYDWIERQLLFVKTIIPILLILLWYGVHPPHAPSGAPAALIVRSAFVVTAIAAGCLYWGFFTLHRGALMHEWDFSHYYLGAKYFPENGYTCLYDSISFVERDLPIETINPNQPVRNLTTNEFEPLYRSQLRGGDCRNNFTINRWQSFASDVQYFRERLGNRWLDWRQDHGFNATPVWMIVGTPLTNLLPRSDVGLTFLMLLDQAYILGAFLMLWWGFGRNLALMSFAYFGANGIADFSWTGGSLLRQDWLFFLIASVCFARRSHPWLSGACLAYSIGLRLFPIIALLGPLIVWGTKAIHQRSLSPMPQYRRFLFGGLTTGLALALISMPASGRPMTVFQEFAINSRKHMDTPVTNHVGLKTVISSSAETRGMIIRDPGAQEPYGFWKAERQRLFQEREWFYWSAVGVFLAVFAWAVRGHELWTALTLSLGMIPIVGELTNYYYSFFAPFIILGANVPALAPISLALAAITNLFRIWFSWLDDLYVVASWALICFVLVAFLLVGTKQRPSLPP